jgi:hypothetical protein
MRVFLSNHFGSFQDLNATGSGKGVAMAYRRGRDPMGLSHQQEYVNYETEPPQF